MSPREALNEAYRLRGEPLNPGVHRSLRMLDAAVARIGFTGRKVPQGGAPKAVLEAFVMGVHALAAWHAVTTGEQHETAAEMADDRAWLAAFHAGAATAMSGVAKPGPRPGSAASELVAMLTESFPISVASANALLAKPMDDSTARRTARKYFPGAN